MLATESHDSDAYDIIDGIINGIFDNNDNYTGKDNNNNSNQDDDYFSIFSDNDNVDRDAEEEEDDERDNCDGSELDDNFHHKLTTNNDHDEAVDQHVVVEDRYEVGDHHVLDNEPNMMYDDTHVMIDDHHREGGGVVICVEGDDHDSDYNPSR